MRADADLREQIHAVAVDVEAGVGRGDALEQAEQQRRARDVQRLPVAEDHDGEGQKAEARHVAVGRAVGRGQRVDEAAHTGQRAGDGRAGVAHLVDVDAERVCRLRIFAARAQAQAKARLVQQDRQDDEQQDAHIGGEIHFIDKGLPEEAEVDGLVDAERALFDHEPAGRVAAGHVEGVLVGDDADEEQHQRRRQQVERRAADGLIGTQVDRRERQQQREQRAHSRRHEHGQQHETLQRAPVTGRFGGDEGIHALHLAHEEHADERAEDHDALECEVDDAAALGKHAGERHDHERDGIDQCLLDEKAHACSPPSATGASASGSVMAGSGCRSGSPSDCAGSTG